MVQASVYWFGLGAVALVVAGIATVIAGALRGRLRSPLYNVPALFSTIAGLGYGVMALVELGLVPAFIDDPQVLLAVPQYVSWLLTAALITYYLGMLANADMESRLAGVGASVLMVVAGFVAVLTGSPVKWGAFVLSVAFFVGVLYIFLRTYNQSMVENSTGSRGLFETLRDLTVSLWLLYPVVFVLGPFGIGVLASVDYHFLNVFLDIASRGGFVGVILMRQYELRTFLPEDVSASPN
ncbi:MAG: bacteriorhodopsin [Halorientalis sp.]